MQDIYVLNRQTSYSMLPRLNKHPIKILTVVKNGRLVLSWQKLTHL